LQPDSLMRRCCIAERPLCHPTKTDATIGRSRPQSMTLSNCGCGLRMIGTSSRGEHSTEDSALYPSLGSHARALVSLRSMVLLIMIFAVSSQSLFRPEDYRCASSNIGCSNRKVWGSNVLHFLGLVPGLEGGKICLRHRAML
jgi:hypothetical protein